ncbi:MAG: flagellar biosynthesis anti-sigma factor FlgM [Bryobacteraceae bacterium]
MRIDDLNRANATEDAEQAGQTGQQRPPEKSPLDPEAVGGPDQAEVSRLAQSLAAPDAGRIEQLRLEVQSGNYDVSAETLANALIEAHLKD